MPGLVEERPQVVIDALSTFYGEYNANVHRGIYTIGERSTAAYEAARVAAARYRGSPSTPAPRDRLSIIRAFQLVMILVSRSGCFRSSPAGVLTSFERRTKRPLLRTSASRWLSISPTRQN